MGGLALLIGKIFIVTATVGLAFYYLVETLGAELNGVVGESYDYKRVYSICRNFNRNLYRALDFHCFHGLVNDFLFYGCLLSLPRDYLHVLSHR